MRVIQRSTDQEHSARPAHGPMTGHVHELLLGANVKPERFVASARRSPPTST
jgi:hypothetical protein